MPWCRWGLSNRTRRREHACAHKSAESDGCTGWLTCRSRCDTPIKQDVARVPSRRRIQLLYVGDAALARDCFVRPGGSIDLTEALPRPDGTVDPVAAGAASGAVPYDILLIEHGHAGVEAPVILQNLRARNIRIPAVVVADWDERLAADALRLGASDYLVRNRASFRAMYFRLHRLIAHSSASGSDAASSHREREELGKRLAEAERARHAAEADLRKAIEALKQARQDRLTDAVTAAKEHALRESELAARVAEANSHLKRLDAQIRDQGALLRLLDQRAVRAEQIAATATGRQAEIETALRQEAATRRSVEAQLTHATDAIQESDGRRALESAAFEERLSEQQAQFRQRLAEAARQGEALEQRLHDAIADATRVREEMAAAASAAAERDSALNVELRHANDDREQLTQRLLEREVALRAAEQRVIAAHQSGQQKLDDQHAEFELERARQRSTSDTLRHEILVLTRALQQSEDCRVAEVDAAADRFTELQTQYEEQGVAADASRQAFEAKLADREKALTEATEQHAFERAEATRLLAEARQEANARQTHAAQANVELERKLHAAEIAREQLHAQHASDIAGVTARAAARLEQQQQEAERWVSDAAAVANAFEDRLSDARGQIDQLRAEAVKEREAAMARTAEQERAFEVRLAQEIATRESLNHDLRESRSALDTAIQRHQREMTTAAARLVDAEEKSSARLTQAATAIKVAESKRTEAIAALNRVVQQAAAERKAASVEAADLRSQLKDEVAREVTNREEVERQLAETRAAAAQMRQQWSDDVAAAERRASDQRVHFEQQSAEQSADWERRRIEAEQHIHNLDADLEQTRQRFADAEEQIRRLTIEQAQYRTESGERQRIADRDLAELRSQRDTLQATLDQARATADETLARVTQDRSLERARFEALVADLQSQLSELAARSDGDRRTAAAQLSEAERRFGEMRASRDQARDSMTHLEGELKAVRRQLSDLAARTEADRRAAATQLSEGERRLDEMRASRDLARDSIAHLEGDLKSVRGELELAKRQIETQRATAERVPVLEKQLQAIQAESRRQFDDNPTGWFRCRRSGELLQANRAIGHLLGYGAAELQRIDFGTTVFDCASDFRWILDRCLSSGLPQSMETPWKRKDRRQIIVRVVAVPAGTDAVDLVAEDVTHIRELEEKLRNAQRLEAVARYGSEVAVTCQGLLDHVKQEGHEWLSAIESDTVRYRGELLLDEVTRAGSYLAQLAAYGEEQQKSPNLVDVNKVLRDLEPVLKRVAGDNIDLVLPKVSAPLNLDVEARPVERMLVNVAAYGRERMPLGGRLKIDLDSVVFDREFVAKHPNVRPGEHVLLIVNEQRRVVRPETSVAGPAPSSAAIATFSGDSPGVDLGVLQALVTECGGHLWMRAEPPGDMELKIHLPRRVLDRSEQPALPAGRSRWIRRAFGARH